MTEVEWETIRTVEPPWIISRIRASLFCRKNMSPTLRTSSRMRISGVSRMVAMAKPRRETIGVSDDRAI